jgi:ATP-dependent Clp protease ATP-binding subunit ClpA
MFERFTRDARDAVVGAQAAARSTGSRSIDSRHLLLALVEAEASAVAALRAVGVAPATLAAALRDDVRAGGLDAGALASVGIDLDAVRERADSVFGEGALDRGRRPPVKGHIPFTADAKKSLELALREAVRLRRNRIDTAMLLLGLLRASGSGAAITLERAVRDAGSSPGALRTAAEDGGAAQAS